MAVLYMQVTKRKTKVTLGIYIMANLSMGTLPTDSSVQERKCTVTVELPIFPKRQIRLRYDFGSVQI